MSRYAAAVIETERTYCN